MKGKYVMEYKKRVALYSRFSTHTQDGNYSIEIQIERMTAMCASKGWEVVDHFSDAAYSGANMERPDLKHLLSRLDEFDVVMVYRLDRLSRSQRDTMELIQDHFLKNNVAFVSVSETLDTTTPFGMAMIGILAVFAELERATITERMQGGLEKRVQEGYRIMGGNYTPTGYSYKKGDERMEIDEVGEKLVKRLYDLYEQTHSITKIQYILKEEGFPKRKFTTLLQILRNRLYIGEVSYAGKYYKGVHESIISKEQFDRVQILLSRHPQGNNFGKSKESLFGGLITCGKCGEPYTTYSYKVKTKSKGNYYVRSYICRARRFPGEYEDKCFNETYKNVVLEGLFKKELNKIITDQLLSVDIKRPDKQKNYELAIKRIDEKISRLVDLYEDGEMNKETLNSRIAKRNEEKEQLLDKQSLDLQNELVRIDLNEIDDLVMDFDKLDFSDKRALIEKVLNGIIINDDEVIFDWHF